MGGLILDIDKSRSSVGYLYEIQRESLVGAFIVIYPNKSSKYKVSNLSIIKEDLLDVAALGCCSSRESGSPERYWGPKRAADDSFSD